MLKALTTTNATIAAKQDALAGFLAGTAGFAKTATSFLDANGDRIIQVGRVQRPTLALAARYAPEYPCFAEGLANWIPRANAIFSNSYFHITLEVIKPRAPYKPGEEPVWGDHRGPNCQRLPSPPYTQANPKPGVKFNDGTKGSGTQSPSAFPAAGSALPSYFSSSTASGIPRADSGLAGTAGEQQVVARLFAQNDAEARPSAITTLLAGPMLRGTLVNQS
jgi:phospholipid/cholesterol/gamma-HCH transport system substrate-binding protein